MQNTNGYRSSHLGRSSTGLVPRQQNPFRDEPNASRKLSPIAGLQEPMFSRVATPLKPLNIPYPQIKSHPRNRRPSPVQPTKLQENYGCDIDPQNGMSNCRNDLERAPDEMKRDGATKRSDEAQELYEDEEGRVFKEISIIARQDTASTNAEKHRERQRMDMFKTHLEKLLTEAKAVQEELKARLGEGIATIQEASKSNLDVIQQKRDEAEKAIEILHESKKAQLEDTACASVQKVEAFTETSLSKLKKFTENWLSTSCNAIANRLKPYLGSSTKVDTKKIQNGGIGCRTPIKQEQRKTSGSVDDSPDKKRKSGALLGGSSKTGHDAEQSSSSTNEGAMSGTHLSGGTSQGSSTRTLRRSKRTKQRKDQKSDPDESQNTTSTTKTHRSEKQQKKKSPTTVSQAKKAAERSKTSQPLKIAKKSERALCVTPTERTSRSLKKDRTKPTSSSSSLKKSKAEINRLKPLRTRRKRQKSPSLSSTKKRLKVNVDSSQPSVPSEVVAFSHVQLSPLEGPDLFSFPFTKAKSESSFGKKKRKSSPTKTYGRKKMTFDVMDNDDVFRFWVYRIYKIICSGSSKYVLEAQLLCSPLCILQVENTNANAVYKVRTQIQIQISNIASILYRSG